MIIYQVRLVLKPEIEEDWLYWMRAVHIPDVIATGLIRNYQFLKERDSEELVYYAKYHFDSIEDYKQYESEFAPQLKQDVIERYPDQFTASRKLFNQI